MKLTATRRALAVTLESEGLRAAAYSEIRLVEEALTAAERIVPEGEYFDPDFDAKEPDAWRDDFRSLREAVAALRAFGVPADEKGRDG